VTFSRETDKVCILKYFIFCNITGFEILLTADATQSQNIPGGEILVSSLKIE
jgi:hypothetical protein